MHPMSLQLDLEVDTGCDLAPNVIGARVVASLHLCYRLGISMTPRKSFIVLKHLFLCQQNARSGECYNPDELLK